MPKIVIAPEWKHLLRAHRLLTVADVYGLKDDARIIKCIDSSEVQRVALQDEVQAHTLIIRKYWVTKPSQLWSGFWRGTFLGPSKVRGSSKICCGCACGLDASSSHFFRRTEGLRFFFRYAGHASLTSDDKKLIRVVLIIAVSWPERQYRRVERAQRITGE